MSGRVTGAESLTVTEAGFEAVAALLGDRIRRTPVIRVDRADFGLPPGPLVFKLEQLQHTGSFKARGALANLLLREVPSAGVVAASGGNHGAAVAYAARAEGVAAHIFVPEVSSPAKTARIREYGANLVVTGRTYADALAASQEWATSSDALQVHAYDQDETMLGAGTLALELREQAPDVTTVIAAVGGGGLLGGIAACYAGSARMIAAEPEASPTLARALDAGRPVDAPAGGIAADSLAPASVGVRNYPVLARYVSEVVLVSDDEIVRAQRSLWDRMRLVAEPGGAAALAALLSGRVIAEPDDVVAVVISGANTTAVDFST